MTVHNLKIWPVHFAVVRDGDKRAEFRKDDRSPKFQAGDFLKLEEYDPDLLVYTEEVLYRKVTHVARGAPIPEGYAMLSLGHPLPHYDKRGRGMIQATVTEPAPATDGDSWATPENLFRAYNWEFGFTLDAAARAHNAKLPNVPADGLTADWGGHRVWVNPPYSDVRPWVEKAARREADVVALLLPVRTGTDWWRLYVQDPDGRVLADGVRFFRKRVQFEGAKGSPSWETALVIYRARPGANQDGGAR